MNFLYKVYLDNTTYFSCNETIDTDDNFIKRKYILQTHLKLTELKLFRLLFPNIRHVITTKLNLRYLPYQVTIVMLIRTNLARDLASSRVQMGSKSHK